MDETILVRGSVSSRSNAKIARLLWLIGGGLLVIPFLCGVFAHASPRGAAAGPTGSRARVQAKLNDLQKEAHFPGATLGVVLPDGHSYSLATGLADVERNIPMRPSDRMLSGSIGKTYVSAVMLQLIQEGKARLDERIDDWFGKEPWFPRLPNGPGITLRMLLNHTSGIPNHVSNKDFIAAIHLDPDRPRTPEELVGFILGEPPLFPAGTRYAYADTNYILVGMIIERITHTSYYDEVETRFLKPLHLTNTFPSDKRVIPSVVSGYTNPGNPFGFSKKVSVDGRDSLNPQVEWTGGGLVSTALDLARWSVDLYAGNVLTAASREELLTTVDNPRTKGLKYGLGVDVRDTPYGVSYGHVGEFPGFASDMEYFPKHHLGVAMQFNTDDLGAFGKPIRDCFNEMVGTILEGIEPTTRD